MKLSIVVPLYCCEKSVEELVLRCTLSLDQLPKGMVTDCEFILVDDGSPEGDWEVVKRLARVDRRVKGAQLSRNFGQHAAITAGLERASGDTVVVMDGDLQDRPEEIPRLLAKYLELPGCEGVVARRTNRRDGVPKRLASKAFYFCLRLLTGLDRDPAIANFGVYSDRVIGAVLSLPEKERFFPLFVQWVGFNIAVLDVEHAERTIGKSSYTYRKALRLAYNALLSFSDKPLRLMVKMGFASAALSLLVAVIYFLGALFQRYTVQGWPSVIISIWFLGGIQILFLGLVGMYIGKTFEQAKGRPIYVVREELGVRR